MSSTSVELCPKCGASMTFRSYTLPFATNTFRAYHNLSRNDAFTLESGLSDPISESAAVAGEIQRVESLLATLKRHRAHLDYHIRQTRAYITHSPIRQLPTEILALIFSFACTSFEPKYHKTPLSISLVCSRWRDIAMAAPRLWTNIYAGPEPEARALFKYYLERCGELPISLKIDKLRIQKRSLLTGTGTPDESASGLAYRDHWESMHEIYSTFRRWIAVEFHVGMEDLNLLFDHTTKEEFGLPVLESLTFALKDKLYSEHISGPSAFRNAPRLTHLDLNDPWGKLWRDVGLPTNVSELHTNQDDLEYLARLNPLFTDNKNGNTTLVLYPSRPGLTFRPVTGTFLLSPSITHVVFNPRIWTTGSGTFLEEVSIPGLKALTIVARDPTDPDGCESWGNLLEAIPKLLQKTKHSLELFNLTMHGRYGAQHICLAAPMATTLVQALQAMPELRSLTIIEAISGPPLLTELIPAMMNHSLIPKLETLELVWAEDRHPDDSLMTMLSSRVGDGEGISGLCSVVLGRRNGGEFMPPVLDHLQELRKSGARASLW